MSMRGEGSNHGALLRAALLLAITLAPAAAAGCGGSDNEGENTKADNEAAVKKVLGQLQQASVAGDGKRICTQIFTPNLENAVMRAARSGSCAEEVRRQLFSRNARLTVQDVTVNDPANATATVREANGNSATLFFIKQSGRWRIRTLQPA